MYRAPFGAFHTAIDMAFGRYGDLVHASMRGRVTYSDPNGWDKEKGVVILEHIFPDGSLYYTLYGHMEQLNGHSFPPLGSCVEKGDVIGTVGHPAGEAPHLHYEIRRMDGNIGGAGYASVDPLLQGWFHPVDFTERAQLTLHPYFRAMRAANAPPIAAPVFLTDGGLILPETSQIEQLAADGSPVWQLGTTGLTGMLALPGNRLLAVTTDRIFVIANGQFSAAWQPDRVLTSPPIGLGNVIAFLTTDRRVVAYSPDGNRLWETASLGDHVESDALSGDGSQLAVSSGDKGQFKISVIDPGGQITFQAASPSPIALAAAPGGDGFLVMTATQVGHLNSKFGWQLLLDSGQPLARGAQVTIDSQGNVYLYPGYGTHLLAFDSAGKLRWQTDLPGVSIQPPLLATGAGCLIYTLMGDGTLLAFNAQDGKLSGQTALYSGGEHNLPAARWLRILPGEQVQFSAGYLSIATIDGPTLAGLKGCASPGTG